MYRRAGYDLRINLNPGFFSGWEYALFCILYVNGKPLSTGGGGISLSELNFFESLRSARSFSSIFVIGNSGGWSTLAFSLLWPEARVVAIDCGMLEKPNKLFELFDYDRHRGGFHQNFGIDLTNTLAREHHLDAEVVLGTSPQDLSRVIGERCKTPPQMVFIDGGHSNAQLIQDFAGLRNLVEPDCLVICHDVVNWHMEKGFRHCCETSHREGRILWRTSSGMGVILPPDCPASVREIVEAYAEDEETLIGPDKTYPEQIPQRIATR
jgi:predicted O-methyltransferase YrrM